MNPARPLAQVAAASSTSATAAAGTAAARTTPRRRVRPSSADSASATTLVPPSRDLIGPPCPLSNLRPVYYAPLFPSLHAVASPSSPSSSGPSSSRPAAAHPYSLSEFPTAASSSSPSTASTAARANKLARLRDVQHALATADLAWRLARYRLDAFNQAFWARHNAEFLRQRDAFLGRQRAASDEGAGDGARGDEAYPPGPSAALSPVAGGASDVALASFYAQYLEHTRADYARYNTQLWRMQGALLWPAVRAEARRWRWRWECWRAGVRPDEV